MHAPRRQVPLCTLATIPRQPEHCIEWAHLIAWESEKPFPVLDKDDPAHVEWIYAKALERARKYNIQGVTYSLTQGVIKNIIPAIASTNAIIAAACTNEALKIATSCAPALGLENNYMMYAGAESIYTLTLRHERKEDCPVCGTRPRNLPPIKPTATLGELLDSLEELHGLKKPSATAQGKTLYMRTPPSLEEATRPNLERSLEDLGLVHGQELAVTDPAFPSVVFGFILRFEQ